MQLRKSIYVLRIIAYSRRYQAEPGALFFKVFSVSEVEKNLESNKCDGEPYYKFTDRLMVSMVNGHQKSNKRVMLFVELSNTSKPVYVLSLRYL